MTKYEAFQVDFLKWLAQYFPDSPAHVNIWSLSAKYDIPRGHVEELLSRWDDERLICLRAFDGAKVAHWTEWPSRSAFFCNSTDNGYVRVLILADGGNFVEQIGIAERESAILESPENSDQRAQKIGFLA